MAQMVGDGGGAARKKPAAPKPVKVGKPVKKGGNTYQKMQMEMSSTRASTRAKTTGSGSITGGAKGRGAAPKSLVGNLGRTPRPKAGGGGIDLGKFANEVSTNFARGVQRATAPRGGGGGIGLPSIQSPGIKKASGKSGAASGAYLRKVVRGR